MLIQTSTNFIVIIVFNDNLLWRNFFAFNFYNQKTYIIRVNICLFIKWPLYLQMLKRLISLTINSGIFVTNESMVEI